MSRYQRADGWFDTQVNDEVLMMHNETGRFVSLNDSAGAIWAALKRPQTNEDLVSVLLDQFDVTEVTARLDVVECLAELEEQGVVIAEEG